jgi:hypothetical protein
MPKDVSGSSKFLSRNKTVNFVNKNTKVNFQTYGSGTSCQAVTTGRTRVEARGLRAEMVFHGGWSGRLLLLDYSMKV